MKRIFISLPYTSPNQAVVENRVMVAESYFMKLLQQGDCPVSPIVVGHNFVTKYKTNCSFKFWEQFCASELKSCTELHILMLDGWDESLGVKKEIQLAKYYGLEILYINVSEI